MVEKSGANEESIREGLLDVVAVVKVLSPYCQTVSDLAEMVELAITNDAQFRLFLKLMKEQGKK